MTCPSTARQMRAATYAGTATSTASAVSASPEPSRTVHPVAVRSSPSTDSPGRRRTPPSRSFVTSASTRAPVPPASDTKALPAVPFPPVAFSAASRARAAERIPRTSEPCSSSIAASCGKAARIERSLRIPRGDAAEQRRDAGRSAAWRPSRRVAKVGDGTLTVALGAVVAARGDEGLEGHSELAGPAEEVRARERAELRGDAEDETLGAPGGASRPTRRKYRRCAGFRADERGAEPELPRQRACLWLARHPGVGAAVEEEAFDSFGDEVAPQAGRPLEHTDLHLPPELHAARERRERRREPRDARAHDD